jgi:tetratricopeptide (TPR) repeat protein
MADWFRNTTWDDTVEHAFNQKLRCARSKGQYLRIQASTLATSHPQVALKLLDLYFELPDAFDHAQAHVDRATAYLALGRTRDAIMSYEAALEREAQFPNLQTQAYLNLPYLVATQGLNDLYDRATALLEEHKNRLMFPVDLFRWHASYALMASDIGESRASSLHAVEALEAAAQEKSGFRHHPAVGLVTEQYDEIIERVRALRVA